MIQKLKQTLITLSAAVMLAVPMLVPATAGAQAADIENNLCSGAQLSTAQASCSADTEAPTRISNLVVRVVNLLSWVVGVVAVIMIIIGGLRYITSAGDSSNVTSAKNTILYAIIGLVIVALAQFIVRFVLARVTS